MTLAEHYFDILAQSAGTIYWTIALLLLFLKVPLTEEYRPYRRSKNFLSLTYFIMGLNVFVWLGFFSDNWVYHNPYVMCLDICFFYLAAIFFGCSFCNLLDSNYITWKRIVRDLLLWAATSFCLVLSQVHGILVWVKWVSMILALLLFIEVIAKYLYRFHRLYARKKQMLDNYFSEDMQGFMSWLKVSLAFTLMSGVLAVMSIYFGITYNYFYEFYVISVNLYIAISFINYNAQYGRIVLAEEKPVEMVQEEEEIERSDEMDNYEQLFGEHLERWINDKKYLAAQITIEDLAGEMATNKLYVSRYINKKYNSNFSNWITSLRIEEAMKFMRANPNIKQEEVAFHSGFSSSSYFSKVFSRIVGKTPLTWRRELDER